jgi:hypothetical protein
VLQAEELILHVLTHSNRSHAFAKAGMNEEALQDAIKYAAPTQNSNSAPLPYPLGCAITTSSRCALVGPLLRSHWESNGSCTEDAAYLNSSRSWRCCAAADDRRILTAGSAGAQIRILTTGSAGARRGLVRLGAAACVCRRQHHLCVA